MYTKNNTIGTKILALIVLCRSLLLLNLESSGSENIKILDFFYKDCSGIKYKLQLSPQFNV